MPYCGYGGAGWAARAPYCNLLTPIHAKPQRTIMSSWRVSMVWVGADMAAKWKQAGHDVATPLDSVCV